MSDEETDGQPTPRRVVLSRLQRMALASAIADYDRSTRIAQARLDDAMRAVLEDAGQDIARGIVARPVVEGGDLVALDLIERE